MENLKTVNQSITKKQRYVLLLNNSYDTKENDQICSGRYTALKGVLHQEYIDLKTLPQDMLGLDDSITIGSNSWHVEGSFPIIAEEHDGEMINIITGASIEYNPHNRPTNNLSYCKKYPISNVTASMLLHMVSHDYETTKRYQEAEEALIEMQQTKLENHYFQNDYNKFKKYCIYLDDDSENMPFVAIKDGSFYTELTSNTPVYQSKPNEITSNVTFSTKIKLRGKEGLIILSQRNLNEYRDKIEELSRLAKYNYQNYKYQNQGRTFSTRVGAPLTKKKQINK